MGISDALFQRKTVIRKEVAHKTKQIQSFEVHTSNVLAKGHPDVSHALAVLPSVTLRGVPRTEEARGGTAS